MCPSRDLILYNTPCTMVLTHRLSGGHGDVICQSNKSQRYIAHTYCLHLFLIEVQSRTLILHKSVLYPTRCFWRFYGARPLNICSTTCPYLLVSIFLKGQCKLARIFTHVNVCWHLILTRQHILTRIFITC